MKMTLEQYRERSTAARMAARAGRKEQKLKQSPYKEKKEQEPEQVKIFKTVRMSRAEKSRELDKIRQERYNQIKGTTRKSGRTFADMFRRKKNVVNTGNVTIIDEKGEKVDVSEVSKQ